MEKIDIDTMLKQLTISYAKFADEIEKHLKQGTSLATWFTLKGKLEIFHGIGVCTGSTYLKVLDLLRAIKIVG